MNSIRTADRLEKAWLRANTVNSQDGQVTVQSELFDGTVFTFSLAEHEVERQDSDTLVLVPVGLNGGNATFSEIVLPKPVLNFGHIVRVDPNSVIKWLEYRKLKELRENGKP
jgi:hypothetical protein